MKLETIINVYSRRNKLEDPLLLKVLNSIKDFNRRMDLKPAYREIKQIFEDYEEERTKYVKKLVKEFCDEENERNKDHENYVELRPEEINSVPNTKMTEYSDEIKKWNKREVELKNKLVFYRDEIEHAKLVFSEEELIDEFVDWSKNKPSPKKSTKKK